MQTFLMSESSPAEIQTEISLLSIVQAAVIMSSSLQTVDLTLLQDRVAIKKHKTATDTCKGYNLAVHMDSIKRTARGIFYVFAVLFDEPVAIKKRTLLF